MARTPASRESARIAQDLNRTAVRLERLAEKLEQYVTKGQAPAKERRT